MQLHKTIMQRPADVFAPLLQLLKDNLDKLSPMDRYGGSSVVSAILQALKCITDTNHSDQKKLLKWLCDKFADRIFK